MTKYLLKTTTQACHPAHVFSAGPSNFIIRSTTKDTGSRAQSMRGMTSFTLHRPKRLLSKNKIHGFTLIEVMVVVIILGILAAMIVPKIMSRPEQARIVKTKQDILAIQSALDLYKLDNSFYPSTDQGLQALVTKPSLNPIPHNWKSDGYLQKLPTDPWGEPYQYINENEKLRIYSFGAKGREGNSDIDNWNIDDKV